MKHALNIEEQINRLKERGMIIDNEKEAKDILLDIGYYRLGFYSFPFEKTFPILENRDHKLKENTRFSDVVELYYFDSDLRKLLLNALNKIEINIRTQITYIVSNHYPQSPTWFVNPMVMKQSFIDSFNSKVYDSMMDNPIIKRHHQKYINDKYAPAWKVLEFMTLGNLCSLYLNLKDLRIQKEIAWHYKCSFGIFINYLETIRVIRNKCAHGNCLYNISLTKGIKCKPANILPENRHNIMGIINVIQYFLGQISSSRLSEFNNDIKKLLQTERSTITTLIIDSCTKIKV